MVVFLMNFSERINEEISTWYEDSPPIEDGAPSQGVIAPAICPAGTVSRRSVHKLWVTLTNATVGFLFRILRRALILTDLSRLS